MAAAKCGAHVLGMDIDFLLLHGLSKSSCCGSPPKSSRLQPQAIHMYSLGAQYLDVIVGDTSIHKYSSRLEFDAIVTDPPYGIRESSQKVGSHKNSVVPPECLANHYPSKIRYDFDSIVGDLMELAGGHLVYGGRLVFWVPVSRPLEVDLDFEWEGLRMVSKCEQILTRKSSRFLVCMEKVGG